jgi:hypothetical protein
MLRTFALLLLAVTLAACSSHPAPADTGANAPASASTNSLAGTPMAAYGHALNKAKNVQNVVNAQARKQAQAIESQTH